MKILILGGTTEARVLAGRLNEDSGFDVTLSLAGRTARPRPQGVPTRIGGFGGAEGLARALRDAQFDVLVDATHPYADRISANAASAAEQTRVRFLALRRAPWTKVSGDRWIDVESVEEAVAALGLEPRRVFVALGRKEIEPFAAAPQHVYLVRSVDPLDPPLTVPCAIYVTARGPFSEAGDRDLLERHGIDIVVAKNSGGEASYGKIAAARALRLPVIVLRRPALPPTAQLNVCSVGTVEDALAWLGHAVTAAAARGV